MMDRWTIVGVIVVAGLGALAYLRVVSNELAVRLRALTLQVEADERHRKSASSNSADEPRGIEATAATEPEPISPEPISAERAA